MMLRECIGNLIENSLAYSLAGGEIIVCVDVSNTIAHITVQDCGPGIPEKYQELALGRFYRIPGTTPEGCGIGLSIVQQTLKNLQGELIFKQGDDGSFLSKISFPIS
ncbi:MAG: ATP-binding protein [Arenicellales bacterium]